VILLDNQLYTLRLENDDNCYNENEVQLSSSSPTNALHREYEKQREAAEAHTIQRDILIEELHRVKEQCRITWESLLLTYDKLLHDWKTMKAKYHLLRERVFHFNNERFTDELAAVEKEYMWFLPNRETREKRRREPLYRFSVLCRFIYCNFRISFVLLFFVRKLLLVFGFEY
jgi:type I site-specific restriction endonuclease